MEHNDAVPPPDADVRSRSAGVFVISLTPFDRDGAVDEPALRTHLLRMADAGVGVYVGGGGSGEGYVLRDDESARIFAIAADVLRGRVPARAMGVEPRSAAEMIAFVCRAREAGLEAAQLYSLDPGHGRRPRPDEQEAYFRDVLDAVELPSVLSTHQSVGYFVDPALVRALLDDYPHLVGVNVTSPDATYLVRMLDAVGGRVEVHVGGPAQALTALALGGTGYLVSEANLAPRTCARVVDAWRAGRLDDAADAYRTVMELFTVTQANGGVSGIKAALTSLGHPGGVPRRPRLAVPGEWCDAIVAAVDALGLRAVESL